MFTRFPLLAVLLALGLPSTAYSQVLVTGGDGACTVGPAPTWRNTLNYHGDPFVVQPLDGAQWVKFTILLCDPTRVYFQDSNALPLHFPFATQYLDPFRGWTQAQFDAATLNASGQQAVLGAVLLPGIWQSQNELAVQLVRRDAYTREQVRDFINLVVSVIDAPGAPQILYFPTYEQQASAAAEAAWLAQQDPSIMVSSVSRWSRGDQVYAEGWNIGMLREVPAAQVGHAFRNGLINAGDIVLTDNVPAEMPPVAGIISLAPATPNSHVAILSQTFGVPFVHLVKPEDQQRAIGLVGRRVVLTAHNSPSFGAVSDVRLLDAAHLSAQHVTELLALKAPPPLTIQPMEDYGAYSAPTTSLTVADVKYFGGKAANMGYLRRSIPQSAPVSLAIGFRLWNEFLDQPFDWEPPAATLRQAIQQRLAAHTWPPNMLLLENDLSVIRGWFTGALGFTPQQEAAILALLQDPQYGFNQDFNLRFRSSTNVEDTQNFSGAGLYDSFSGCLADDLDGDTRGPSICDPTESGERGVFRAIRKVYGSFYNTNAYLERLRRGVVESQVGMALLVHHSTPDDIELANGVATARRTFATNYEIQLVTQAGAVSVTNPDGGGAVPEVVSIDMVGGTIYPTLTQGSNLVQLGTTVLEWDAEYRQLANLLIAAGNQYISETGRTGAVLDFEYKKVAPSGALQVKQIREIPQPATTIDITPFLISAPFRYGTFQGESGEVLALHRTKLLWYAATRDTWLTAEDLEQSLFGDGVLEFTADCRTLRLGGPPSAWPGASHSRDDTNTFDGWLLNEVSNPREYVLRARVPGPVSAAQNPVLTAGDLGDWGYSLLELNVEYSQPVPAIDWLSNLTTTTSNFAAIGPIPERVPGAPPVHRIISGPDGVLIDTAFYWPAPPGGIVAGYTAPLAGWERTIISGLTSEPIVLRDWYSQTYRPGHHNFTESFVFEPGLEPGLALSIRNELAAMNIAQIVVLDSPGFTEQVFYLPPESSCNSVRFAAGDLNCDGAVNNFDIDAFVLALVDPAGHAAAYPGCDRQVGDLNGDLRFDNFDIDPFVTCLVTGDCGS